jgi:hypothetical protein
MKTKIGKKSHTKTGFFKLNEYISIIKNKIKKIKYPILKEKIEKNIENFEQSQKNDCFKN